MTHQGNSLRLLFYFGESIVIMNRGVYPWYTILSNSKKAYHYPIFIKQYGRECQYWRMLFQPRYPAGFQCVSCRHNRFHKLKLSALLQCASFKKQYSLPVGIRRQNNQRPILHVWFDGYFQALSYPFLFMIIDFFLNCQIIMIICTICTI